MDKIDTGNWSNTFSEVSPRLLFANDRYQEAVIRMQEPGLASATIKTIRTPGMELNLARFSTERPLELIDPENMASIGSSYVLQGSLESKFNYRRSVVRHSGATHAFHYTPDFTGSHIMQGGNVEALSCNYHPDHFESLARSSGMPFLDRVMNCIDRGEHLLIAPGDHVLQPRMAALVQQILQCPFSGLTRCLYMEAKMLELFALQMEQLNEGTSGREAWSVTDRERLKAVHDHITQHFSEPLTLAGLCTKSGLNEFKLKKGYKHLFGTTVFGHIFRLRMEAARNGLESRGMTVSEVAYDIGYSNVSSFSAAFKKHFGYLPGSIRNIRLYTEEAAPAL